MILKLLILKKEVYILALSVAMFCAQAQSKKSGSGTKNTPTPTDAVITSEKELNEQLIKRFSATDKVEFYDLKDASAHPNEVTSLKLAHLGLTEVPSEISKFKNLVELDLSDNEISSTGGKLSGLNNLQTLNLSGNKLTDIPSDVNGLKSLLVLNLSGNEITGGSISAEHLERLYLNNNKLSSIPSGIANLKHLKGLYLYMNNITVLEENLLNIKTLELLLVQYNKIKDEPDAFTHTGIIKYAFYPQAIDNRYMYNYVKTENTQNAPAPFKSGSKSKKDKKKPNVAYTGNAERQEQALMAPSTLPGQNPSAMPAESAKSPVQGYVSGSVDVQGSAPKGLFAKIVGIFSKKPVPQAVANTPTFIMP